MRNEEYIKKIKSRSLLHFCKGLFPRLYNYSLNEVIISIARFKGAKIGRDSSISFKLACKANINLVVGENSIIETADVDLRQKVIIGNNVIINNGVQIIRQSHNYDSLKFETIGNDLLIEDYVWITTNSMILPSCSYIREGGILASGSVLVKNMENLQIFGGNPAIFIKNRKCTPLLLNNASLQGREVIKYFKARFEQL